MKTLHLLRHAKSSWSNSKLQDWERPLNRRGQRDAPRMGAALAGSVCAQPVYCSPALRARLTLEGLCTGWPALAGQSHQICESLYTFNHLDLLEWLLAVPAEQEALFLIGHNPAFTDLVNELAGEPVLDNLPTAGYLRLTLPVEDWSELTRAPAVVEAQLFPRTLG
ncbi:SixA phosphatase family protein [Parahaliea aestuarii]|uniref:Phosphoglycerate mutase n=1 Tax=Parahaliea aestuarii TaxID=1852021 RepID=A0A5C8ZLQ1_9GAMM|nr:histidine phosphatase family protein [Parahaliea aestuarii]TXS89095.1 phosphoglycerate mutase [Parahaliea aestuarii]